MPNHLLRRSFLQTASLAAISAGRTLAARNPAEPFRVGCLNVWEYSHLKDLWAPLINPRFNSKDAPMTGMRITHCWDIEPDRAEEFARLFGCQAVRNFDDMVGKVDGVISGGFYNTPWN